MRLGVADVMRSNHPRLAALLASLAACAPEPELAAAATPATVTGSAAVQTPTDSPFAALTDLAGRTCKADPTGVKCRMLVDGLDGTCARDELMACMYLGLLAAGGVAVARRPGPRMTIAVDLWSAACERGHALSCAYAVVHGVPAGSMSARRAERYAQHGCGAGFDELCATWTFPPHEQPYVREQHLRIAFGTPTRLSWASARLERSPDGLRIEVLDAADPGRPTLAEAAGLQARFIGLPQQLPTRPLLEQRTVTEVVQTDAGPRETTYTLRAPMYNRLTLETRTSDAENVMTSLTIFDIAADLPVCTYTQLWIAGHLEAAVDSRYVEPFVARAAVRPAPPAPPPDPQGPYTGGEKFEELIARAVEEFKARRYYAAVASFQRAHRLQAEPAILFNIGRVYEEAQNIEAAIPQYEQFLEFDGLSEHDEEIAHRRLDVLRTIREIRRLESNPPLIAALNWLDDLGSPCMREALW